MLACLYLLDSDLATSSHRPSTLPCRTHVEHMRSEAFSESFSLSFPSNIGTVVHQVPDACLRLPTLASSLHPLSRRAACNRCSCVLFAASGINSHRTFGCDEKFHKLTSTYLGTTSCAYPPPNPSRSVTQTNLCVCLLTTRPKSSTIFHFDLPASGAFPLRAPGTLLSSHKTPGSASHPGQPTSKNEWKLSC